MSQHLSKTETKGFFHSFFLSYIPNRQDNAKQVLLKTFFLLTVTGFLAAAIVFSSCFLLLHHQTAILQEDRSTWYDLRSEDNSAAFEALKSKNGDYKGWLTIPGTQIDNPVYQTNNDSYYEEHNSRKEESDYGALFFSHENKISAKHTDQNLLIYGHSMEDGTMFGSLEKLRSLPFYREHSTIELSTGKKTTVYKIYAVFVLNAYKADDDGYIYNLFRENFWNEKDFKEWVDEAKERSVIQTGVEVEMKDSLVTLITNANDFENARLIVMAREMHKDETADTPNAKPNPSPRYPKRWYDGR